MNSTQYKEKYSHLRRTIVEQIDSLLRINGIKKISFDDALIYRQIDEQGENECISSYERTEFVDQESIIKTCFYADEESSYTIEDMATEQLIWMLEQVEQEKYSIED